MTYTIRYPKNPTASPIEYKRNGCLSLELMGHEKIETTMGYYNPRELHQMGASPQVACLAGDRNTRTAPTRHAV
jgi:hypothetical protein